MQVAETYKALGDPIRLEIVKRVALKPASTIGEISANLGVSRQGARKQLQVLVNAKVLALTQHGRETIVTLNARKLEVARDFIAKLECQWDERLQALKDFAESPEK